MLCVIRWMGAQNQTTAIPSPMSVMVIWISMYFMRHTKNSFAFPCFTICMIICAECRIVYPFCLRLPTVHCTLRSFVPLRIGQLAQSTMSSSLHCVRYPSIEQDFGVRCVPATQRFHDSVPEPTSSAISPKTQLLLSSLRTQYILICIRNCTQHSHTIPHASPEILLQLTIQQQHSIHTIYIHFWWVCRR